MAAQDEILQHLRNEIAALESRLDEKNHLIVALRQQLITHESADSDDRRTQIFRRAAIDIVPQAGSREFTRLEPVAIADMAEALIALGDRLDHKFAEIRALNEITEHVNSGMFFDEVLDHLFDTFAKVIPYDRIGVSLIERAESGKSLVRSQWCRASYDEICIGKGYAAIMEGSSLQEIADSREPRIINDLENYLCEHPNSHSTQLIIREGIRANLTCPIVGGGGVIGFIFFSSAQANTYGEQHIELFQQIAGELAITLEKSRTYEDLYLRNEFIKKVFGQYVTNEVAEAAMNNKGPLVLGGERRTVTVVMADLRGFTPMSEKLSPEDVVDALNIFLGKMSEIVMQYGGNVDNFIGDAVMAVFGVPIAKPGDAARAVACAIAMQNAMPAMNDELESRGLPNLSMGIGLSTGEVVAGNIGSEMRLKYSVIGSTVNMAARIEALASGNQIFASEGTYRVVGDDIRSSGHLRVQLKGFSDPVPIFEVTGISGKYNIEKLPEPSSSEKPAR